MVDTGAPANGPAIALQLASALTNPASWAVRAEQAGDFWVRCCSAPAVLFLGVRPEGGFQVVSVRERADGTIGIDRRQLDGPAGWLLSPDRLLACAAETGLLSGLQLAVHRWPELLSAVIVQTGDSAASPVECDSLPVAMARQLFSRVSDRGLFIPDPECLEAMAEYAAGAGHEINNPLASIIGQTQLLLKSEQLLERRQALETIGAQAWRIRDIIGNSMLFARPPQPVPQSLNLIALIRECLSALHGLAQEHRVEFRFSAATEELPLQADRGLVGQLVSSLVRNSLESIRGANRAGRVEVEVRRVAPDVVSLTIRDDGPGAGSEEIRRHLFNPFFSGRPAGRGLGFGLSLAWQIVRLHGGLIYALEHGTGGLSVEIAIPAPPQIGHNR
ncbi:MAG: sensor histidine kinase [Planctomycetota bacterium]